MRLNLLSGCSLQNFKKFKFVQPYRNQIPFLVPLSTILRSRLLSPAFTTPSAYFAPAWYIPSTCQATAYITTGRRHTRGWRDKLPSAGAKQNCLGQNGLATEFYCCVIYQACATDGRRFIVGAGARQPRVKSKIPAPQQPGLPPPSSRSFSPQSAWGWREPLSLDAGGWTQTVPGERRGERRASSSSRIKERKQKRRAA